MSFRARVHNPTGMLPNKLVMRASILVCNYFININPYLAIVDGL